MKILLIEDDEVLTDVLLKSLASQNYVVDAARDGQSGWEYAESAEYDLILIDVGLPKLDGITLCQRLRSQGCTTPILLMTAKDAPHERIRGLDAGADDYLTKPLDLAELQARVRALLRRGTVPNLPVLQIGDLLLNPSSCQVTYANQPLTLTPKEYSLLELFLRNPSRVFSRGQILQHLWTFDDPPLEESVKAHVKGLRQKLKAAGAVDWIENVYGIGYRLKEGVGSQESGGGSQESESTQNLKLKAQNSSSTPHTLHPTPHTPTVETQFDQAMGGLWERYSGLMAQRLAVLQEATTAIQAGELSQELRQRASQAAHKLAGVLGMFEREAGTVLAREIEHILLGEEPLSPTQASKVVSQIEELNNVMALGEPLAITETAPGSETSPLLLIDSDSSLGQALQVFGQAVGMGWKQVKTLEAAQGWLRSHTPACVVLGIDGIGHWETGLSLVSELNARTPSVPVLVLAAANGLLDRVTVARAGGQGFLVKPATAAQVWEATAQLLQRHRSQSVRVLLVDDDPVFVAALRSLLEPWGIRTTGLNDPLRFWDVLQSTAPDLLILDVEMPAVSGIELCQAVRIDPTWQGLPILFLTAHKDSQTVQQVFAAGADDFIIKPIVGPELLTRISNRLERNRLLQTFSSRDPLTGVANQPQSNQELERLLQFSAENRQPFCLIILRAIELHAINVQYSHTVGNQVLQRWGQILQAAFRGGESVGYWGNGEFVLGIPELRKKDMGDRLSDVLKTLRQQVFAASDGQRFQATCQVGIAEYTMDGTTIHSLYQAANSTQNDRSAPHNETSYPPYSSPKIGV
ncbi:response regulator [Kovacikia minuta CCNUW1]|uniref:response regulator n=1 Tax=Kovacikia minuta TaxID=2931930 RepID=UPI001CCB4EE5|nr:response regulator [Kovacikia minuta]UBF25026.1 response regulator [Kovacikia minuta CCNUW1]